MKDARGERREGGREGGRSIRRRRRSGYQTVRYVLACRLTVADDLEDILTLRSGQVRDRRE
eukprot:201233-Hanusia_phi.AAC.3